MLLLLLQSLGIGKLVWNDEFDGDTLNASWWTLSTGTVHRPDEIQLYTSDNAKVSNGSLVITTRRERRAAPTTGVMFNYTSAWVTTGYPVDGGGVLAKFLHAGGRWEVRAMLPQLTCPGVWPAHWLMPRSPCWPMGGEIDIMEMWGKLHKPLLTEKVTVSTTFHYGEDCNVNRVAKRNRKFGKYPRLPWAEKQIPWDNEFHTFAVEWRVNTSLSFFVDDHHVVTLDGDDVDPHGQHLRVPFEPMAWILNTALDATQLSNIDAHCNFPLEHTIDYVRVYEL
jgi:beta-glucanase (GH16 family)